MMNYFDFCKIQEYKQQIKGIPDNTIYNGRSFNVALMSKEPYRPVSPGFLDEITSSTLIKCEYVIHLRC